MTNKKRKGRGRHSTLKIPRDEYVYGTTADVVSSLTFTYDAMTGKASIAQIDPSTITRKLTHKREGKDDKVITSAPADDFSLSLSPFEELKQHFDYLIAVDTNTRKKPDLQGGYAFSATCIYYIAEPIQTLTLQIPYLYLASYLIVDSTMDAKHEPIGWHLALKHHVAHPVLIGKRIGVIVDSELGKHVDMNVRKVPYYANFHLPPNVSLLYASSERTDTFANEMIALCDAGAGRLLAEMERRGLEQLLQNGTPIGDTVKYFSVTGIRSGPSPNCSSETSR
ncbi:hypothetical protein GCM10008969_25080 [Pseudomonas veronii subsp. inensis]|uniref:hypothetical protein n=1 Tax=Pseudomonas veronii TaxID=76761 RepID=UPI0031F7F9E2